MSMYSYITLQQDAKAEGVWIDTQSENVMRGRDTGNTNKMERISRALSWYKISEQSSSDERLIFSYVAFNALYAQPRRDAQLQETESERQSQDERERGDFYKKILVTQGRYLLFVWNEDEIRYLEDILSFQYLSDKYWGSQGESPASVREKLDEEEDNVRRTRKQIHKGDFNPLKIAIRKIGLLRHQLLHGLSAYQDSYNRTQINLCSDFMFALVGRMIKIVIMDNSQDWGKVPYPPQKSPDDILFEIQELED